MCYHYSLDSFNRLKNLYPDKLQGMEPPLAVNGFGHPQMPVVLSKDQDLHFFQWGLVPSHTKTNENAIKIAKMCLNSKIETVEDKVSFRESIEHNRKCLIPFSSFYEWRHEGKNKIKYQISHANRALSYFAGIWTTCTIGEETISSFSILTCPANETMAYIHNKKKRMPVIFSDDKEVNEYIQIGLDADSIISIAQSQKLNGVRLS